ncbi:MAG: hypothetical protein J07HQW1_01229 [Haloquadratum walsbyi J07HQW1]|jgi:hypothetical protein|uniref:Uncharacterized protein n=1 Tax=Haloquadratum walsbyi J07HQW1 TaxID=1238424 RepID=U1PC95_9EURY|nr:MAG: hypothetical protein J07HQW1_01229 [Haloquadratum walsbyi J07HQW1]
MLMLSNAVTASGTDDGVDELLSDLSSRQILESSEDAVSPARRLYRRAKNTPDATMTIYIH